MSRHPQLEANLRTSIRDLTAAGARVDRTNPTLDDRLLKVQLRILCALDPTFAARARTLAGLPPRPSRKKPPRIPMGSATRQAEPAPIRWTSPATYRTADEVHYATAYHPDDWR